MNDQTKPHIEKIEGIWICMSGESPGRMNFGSGTTPYLAWLNWFNWLEYKGDEL